MITFCKFSLLQQLSSLYLLRSEMTLCKDKVTGKQNSPLFEEVVFDLLEAVTKTAECHVKVMN